MTSDWQTRAAAYKASVLASIPADWRLPASFVPGRDVRHVAEESGILTPAEVKLLAQDATSLAAAIRERKYTAVEVATAYCKSAAVAHQTTNCLLDFFPEEALAQAKELDEVYARTGQVVGPLHGVPISVKDMLCIKGRRTSLGFLSVLEGPMGTSTADSVIVATFRAAGAVFYCKTTNPQAIMHLETNNFMGPTTNPYNTALTPGGSSGGESALVAAGGSVLGIGTDIGGSIRNPCANCGLYGFKPSCFRLPRYGNGSGMPSQESIVGAIGPMAVSARDCELFVTTLLAAEPWRVDPVQVKMPWRPSEVTWVGGDKPRIGVMWDDGVVRPQPPMRRALAEAVTNLRSRGFEVVDFPPFKTAEGWALIKKLYFTDGGKHVRGLAEAGGEPLLPLTEWILDGAEPRTAGDVMQLVGAREAYRAMWNVHFYAQNVDIILLPPAPGPAPRLGTSRYWAYTSTFNLTDYPGAVFPFTTVGDADVADPPRTYLSPDDEEVAHAYDQETFRGAPVGLQIVGMRWEDEKVMEALKIVSKAAKA